MDGYCIEACGEEVAQWVHDRIRDYNAQYITDYADISFSVRDGTGTLLGGVAASRDLDCVTVDYLYLEQAARRGGLGAELLRRVEEEGLRQGARRVILNTFSFQAPGFYERQGYRRFGAVEPCLGEYGQYCYVKELTE